MIKSYKYRLNLNQKQIEFFEKCFGCTRFIYNWGLELTINAYKKGINLGWMDICKNITKLKWNKKYKWLKDVPCSSLQCSIHNMDNAFTKFYKKQCKFPKFKSKKHRQSFQCIGNILVNFENHKIRFPKIGWINFYKNKEFVGKIKTVTISKSSTNKYYISICVEDNVQIPTKYPINPNTTVGIDVGIKDFAVLSNGDIYSNPKYFEKTEKRLKILQKRYSKKQTGSKRQDRARLALAKLHEKIKNQRVNYIHKITSKIISENQTIIIEDLDIINLVKNNKLSKYIYSASWSEFFRQLQYKAEWNGVNIVRINRFEPSSKMCLCGFINQDLSLSQRDWICPNCGRHNDRDLLAAINIKRSGLNNLITPVSDGEEDVEWSAIADTVKRQYITI